MVNFSIISFMFFSCVKTAVIAPPPKIPVSKTSSLHSELYFHILQAYVMESEQGHFELVQSEWEKAMTYSHCNPEIHLAYGDMAHRYKQNDIAIQQWERAITCIAWKDQEKRQIIQQKITNISNQ